MAAQPALLDEDSPPTAGAAPTAKLPSVSPISTVPLNNPNQSFGLAPSAPTSTSSTPAPAPISPATPVAPPVSPTVAPAAPSLPTASPVSAPASAPATDAGLTPYSAPPVSLSTPAPAPIAPAAPITPPSAPTAVAAPALPTAAPVGGASNLPAGWSIDPNNPNQYIVPGRGTGDIGHIPTMFNGESTATPGYAQDQSMLSYVGAGGNLYTGSDGKTYSDPNDPHVFSMYDPRTGQNTTDPSQRAAIEAYRKAQDAANGIVDQPAYHDVAQIAGTDPSVYAQELANANPNATPQQQAGINAVNGGTPVTAGTDTKINPVTGIPELASTDNLAGLPAGSIQAGGAPLPQSALQSALATAANPSTPPVSASAPSPADTGRTDPTGSAPVPATGLLKPASTPAGVGSATDTSGSQVSPSSPSSSLSAALAQAASGNTTSTNNGVGTVGTPASNANAPVTTTPTDPNNPLTSQTLSVGALNDPFKMAQDQWSNFQTATDPQYSASLRDALRTAAAGGALGSGQLNTSIGDLTNNRNIQLDTERATLLNDALKTQNDNAYKNEDIAAQQQGFQNQQEQQGFNNNLSTTQEQSALNSTAFAQALSKLTAGNANNPAAMELSLSQIFGSNAAAATATLGALTKAAATNSTTAGTNSTLLTALQDYVKKLQGGTTTGSTTPSGGTSAPAGQPYYDPSDPTNDPSDPTSWTGGISSNG